MAIAFDSFQNISSFGGTNPKTQSFTPVGTPRGIVVVLATNGTSDDITGVDYGGEEMTFVTTFASSHGAADGRLHVYFLGTGIPTGTQTVSVSFTGTTVNKFGGIYAVTAAADTTMVDTTSAQGGTADAREVVVATPASVETFILNAIHSAEDSISGIPAATGHTIGVRNDFGTETWGTYYMTAIQTGGNITTAVGGTGDTWGMIGVAIREGGDQLISLGQPSETETAQTVTAQQGTTINLGLVSETETSQATTSPKLLDVLRVIEQELAQVITVPSPALGGWVTRPSSVAGAGYQNCGTFAPAGVGHNWYAVTGGDVSRVHVTTDGISWLPSKFGFPEFSSQIGGLEGSATTANRVWALTGSQTGTAGGRLMRGTYSPSSGVIEWTEIATLDDGPATSGGSHPRQLGRLLALDEANDAAFCCTIDGIWRVTLSTGAMAQRALAGTTVTGLLLDPEDTNVGWATADGGSSPGFHRIANIRTGTVAVTSNTALADAQDLAYVDDGTNERVWVAAGTDGVRRWAVSADASTGWSDLSSGYNQGGNGAAAIDAVWTGSTTKVAVMNAGNANMTNAGAVSNNAGVTWNNEAGGWTVNDSVLGYNQAWWLTQSDPFFLMSGNGWDSCVVRFDPNNQNILQTWGRSGTWRSTDGGVNWRPSVKGIGATVSWGVNPAPSGDDGYALDGDWGPLFNADQFTTMPSREKPGGNVGTGMGGAWRPDNLRVALAMGDWSSSTNGEVFTSDPPYTSYTDAGFSAVPDDRNRCGVAIGENASGNQVLLTVADGTGIQRKVGTAAPTTVETGITNGFYSLARFWWPDGHTGTQPIVYLSASNGLWRSSDYGATWTRILTYTNSSEYTGRIYGLPANPIDTLFLTIDGSVTGLYRVTNASGSPTLTQVKAASNPGPCVVDSAGFVFFAVTANEAGGNKLYRSNASNPGGGAAFTDITDPIWKAGVTFPSDLGIWANGSLFASDKQGGYFVVDQAVGATVLGQPQETETAPAIVVFKTPAFGQVIETEQVTTFAFAGGTVITLTQVVEAETGGPYTVIQFMPIGQVTEAELAQAISTSIPNGPKQHFTIRVPAYKFKALGYPKAWRVDGEDIP